MVSPNVVERTKQTKEHDFETVQRLAQQQNVQTAGARRMYRHLVKMGYPTALEAQDAPMCAALLLLKPCNYDHSEMYVGGGGIWHDVYFLPNFMVPDGLVYTLYIKLRLNPAGSLLVVCSFHPEGWE